MDKSVHPKLAKSTYIHRSEHSSLDDAKKKGEEILFKDKKVLGSDWDNAIQILAAKNPIKRL